MDERERKNRKLRDLWDGVARRIESPAETGCPDPETLSAYFMHILGKEETAQWEAHFSVCSSCQEALAALVKTASVEETALVSERIREHEWGDMGERVDAAAQLSRFSESEPALVAEMAMASAPAIPRVAGKPLAFEPAPPKTSRRNKVSWRWLVPAVAAVALFAVILTVRLERTPTQSGIEVAENKPAAQPANPNTAEPVPAVRSNAPHEKEKREVTRLESPKMNDAIANPSAARRDTAKKAVGPAASLERETSTTRSAKDAEYSSSNAAAPGPPPASDSANNKIAMQDGRRDALDKEDASLAKQSGGAVGTPSQTAQQIQQPAHKYAKKMATAEERDQAASTAPVGAFRAEQPASGTSVDGASRSRESVNSKLMAKPYKGGRFFAPGGKVIWSLGPAGLVLRSTDGGVSWVRQESGVKADLLSGSAPSELVCWVVGRAGTILLTTDGEHWSTLASPGTQNWIGVQATDALHAVIWDSNHEHKFSTSDGGQTWKETP